MTVVEQAEAPDWGRRYGWLFAAVWLFYLSEPVGALTRQPNTTWRVVGLVAVAAFAVSYLSVVRLGSIVRGSPARTRPFVLRAAIGIAVMLALFVLQIPGAGAHALSCLVYIAAFGMVALPLRTGVGLALFLTGLAEALPALVPGWHDNGYGLAVLLGSLATWGIRL